jgi:PAS domain S-box-containing protein
MARKALVVDNDFFFVEFVADLLESRDYEVLKAYDGKEGISQLDEGPVDILFVDMIMPRIDGPGLIKFARKKYPRGTFPIIACSGTLIEQMETLNKLGADFYIAKAPLEQMAKEISTLMDKIETLADYEFEPAHQIKLEGSYARQITVELIETVNFYKAITESLGIGIIVLDKDGRIISINQAALKILQLSLEQLLNSPIASVFPEKSRAKLVHHLKSLVRDKKMDRTTFVVKMNAKMLRLNLSLLKIEDGISGWVIALEDITHG